MRLFGGELKREYIADATAQLLAAHGAGAAGDARCRRDPHHADAIRLTRRGMYCWVLMMAEFFNSVNNVREQMREHIRTELDAWNEEARVPVESMGRPGQGRRS